MSRHAYFSGLFLDEVLFLREFEVVAVQVDARMLGLAFFRLAGVDPRAPDEADVVDAVQLRIGGDDGVAGLGELDVVVEFRLKLVLVVEDVPGEVFALRGEDGEFGPLDRKSVV